MIWFPAQDLFRLTSERIILLISSQAKAAQSTT